MKDLFKKLYKPLFYIILSVYVLSISINGRLLFDYAHEFFVENKVVSIVSDHGHSIYEQLTDKIRLSVLETAGEPTEEIVD